MLSSPQPLPQTSQPHALTRDGPRTGPVPSFNASVDELLTDTLSAVIMKGGLFLYLMLLDKRRTEKRWDGFKYHVYTSSISFCWILIVWNLKMFLLSEDNHILAQLFLICWVGEMFPSLQMPLQVSWKQSSRARPDHSKPKGITIIGWRDSSLYSKSRSFRIFEASERYGWALLQYVSILFRLFQMYRWWTLLDGLCTLDRLNVSRMNHRIHRYCREESHQPHSLILMVLSSLFSPLCHFCWLLCWMLLATEQSFSFTDVRLGSAVTWLDWRNPPFISWQKKVSPRF